ncbi:MAG: hypothetical protein ACE5G6_07475, partial [Terriglobia bacterium]
MMARQSFFWRSFPALSFAVVFPLLVPTGLGAQTAPENTEARLQALEERIAELEAELQELKAAQAAAPPSPAAQPTIAPAAPGGPVTTV